MELTGAKQRLDTDSISKIYPVIIDRNINYKDTRIPEWLRDEYNLKLIARPSVAARRIHQKLREVSWRIHPDIKARRNLFVGRNDKLEEFEQRLDDFDIPKPRCIIASGLQSVGRRTFLKNAIIKNSLVDAAYTCPKLYLERNDSIEDFILKINDFGFAEDDAEIHDLLSKTIEHKITIAVRLLKAAQEAKEIILILDDGCVVNYKRELSPWFVSLITSPNIRDYPTILCAAKYKVRFGERWHKDNMFYIDIPELSFSERKRLFKKLLEIHKIDLTSEDYNLFCEQFYGFPDQILFCLDLIGRCGIKKAKNDIYQITEFNSDKAAILLRNYENKEDCLEVVRLLAQFEFISKDFLYDIVDEEIYAPLIDQLVAENICEYIGAEAEFIRLNDTIRDYIKRNRIEINRKYKEKIVAHVKKFLREDDHLGRDSSDYIYSIKEALARNIDVDASKLIPSHFLRCMKELYEKRTNLTKVVELADKVLQKQEFIEPSLVDDIRYYLCLALARMKNSRLLQEVQKIHGDEHNFMLGFYYRLVGRHKDAIDRLSKIVHAPYVNARAKRELVQVYVQIEEYDIALGFAKQNYEENRGNQFHIQAYFNCLINSDSYLDYKDTLQSLYKELESVGSHQSKEMASITKALFMAKCEHDEAQAFNIIDDAISIFNDSAYPIFAKFVIGMIFNNYIKIYISQGFLWGFICAKIGKS